MSDPEPHLQKKIKSNEYQEDKQYRHLNPDREYKEQNKQIQRSDCPYLSTIKRHLLDFDFEKLCSISLNNLNVYACLVCGKYYQGRAQGTYAYLHSLEADHHIFINLHNTNVYCLPDNYEVIDHSLWDIQYNLSPYFSRDQVDKLDKITKICRGLDGKEYLAGFVGLNNLKNTDYVNVIIQGLCRVPALRDFLIFHEQKKYTSDVFEFQTLLTKRLSELTRKIWNDKNFKGHVSPHELLQAISIRSGKRFKIGIQSDPIHLLAWYLNINTIIFKFRLLDNLEREFLTINRKFNIISDCFRGEVQIQWYKPLRDGVGYERNPIIEIRKFYYLTLDIPPVPLHKENTQKTEIPHISIYDLLSKFDGRTNKDSVDGRRIYRITHFPKYLLLHMKRFVMNNFFMEKNSTIVSFPVDNLEFQTTQSETHEMILKKYNLLANIVHEGNAKFGVYKVHVRNKAKNSWLNMQDLHITPVMPQLVGVSEAYIQIYQQIE